VRVITLIGPGGTGKTRLALEAARTLGARFDAAFFVALADVADEQTALRRTAQTLGGHWQSGPIYAIRLKH